MTKVVEEAKNGTVEGTSDVADYKGNDGTFGIRAKISREAYDKLTRLEQDFNLDRGDVIEMALDQLSKVPVTDLAQEIYRRASRIFDNRLAALRKTLNISE